MIDSVLKGTGNSRFLKSAVPAGTSWADALAMLQAGTFPIDFNGINTEGFQQVGTPLNKANLLKDATAAQIGLPPSTTPDGMFQALGNTGELHVWRKTVVAAQEIPAGYTLGDVKTKKDISATGSGEGYIGFYMGYSDNLAVDDNGGISLNPDNDYGEVTANSNFTYISSVIAGKFILIRSYQRPDDNSYSSLAGKIFYVPADANISMTREYNYLYIRLSKCQDVTGYPLTPAGTTTTYPVSTNPKAYQEGDDAKPAGYTLGEVVKGKFQFAPNYNTTNAITYQSCSNLQISNDGAVGIDTSDPSYRQVTFKHNTNVDSSDFSNRFVRLSSYSGGSVSPNPQTPFNGAVPSQIVYIPSDTTFDFGSPSTFDRYQPVTGYAAIPAGTTIEYLGKLGDKARVQFGSYVGTGTYGVSNPNTLNLSFTPRFLLVMNGDKITGTGSYANFALFVYGVANGITVGSSSANYEIPLYATWNKNSVSWYNADSDYGSYAQMNGSGTKYRYVAIG